MTIFTTVSDLRLWVSERVGELETPDEVDQITDAIHGMDDFPNWGEDASEFLETLPDDLSKLANRKISFFQNENGMAILAGEGKVLANTTIVDCHLDFGTDNFENIYESISEQIADGETEGSFSNEYEKKYTWEVR